MGEPPVKTTRGKALVAEGLALRILGGEYAPGESHSRTKQLSSANSR
jgi:hypothetical protein